MMWFKILAQTQQLSIMKNVKFNIKIRYQLCLDFRFPHNPPTEPLKIKLFIVAYLIY